MGWTGGGDIFDSVADALIALKVADDVKKAVCHVLIEQLLERGWDTAEGSLGLYADDRAIRSAFGAYGITVKCHEEHATKPWTCEETEGHKGDHRDYTDHNWPQ